MTAPEYAALTGAGWVLVAVTRVQYSALREAGVVVYSQEEFAYEVYDVLVPAWADVVVSSSLSGNRRARLLRAVAAGPLAWDAVTALLLIDPWARFAAYQILLPAAPEDDTGALVV